MSDPFIVDLFSAPFLLSLSLLILNSEGVEAIHWRALKSQQ